MVGSYEGSLAICQRVIKMMQESKIVFFDCNCSFGTIPRPAFQYARCASELLEEMDFCGISKGLVYHAGMRFSSPVIWNNGLLKQIKHEPRLIPTWAILPPQTGEMVNPQELFAEMKACGIQALRAFPQEHRYCLDKLTFGSLFEVLIQYKIPLFAKENILKLKDLLADFPDLTVVAMNQGPHSFERYLRPLLDAYPNLYVDTSYFITDGGIEEFCERYGPGRLLFGSGYPDNCRGGAVLHLLHADISEEAKKAIASDNLERLLNEARS